MIKKNPRERDLFSYSILVTVDFIKNPTAIQLIPQQQLMLWSLGDSNP